MTRTHKRHTPHTDEEIVAMYWQRNEDAIPATDHKYGALLYRLAYNILHDREDCQECQNDTYLGAWNAIPPTRPHVLPAFLTQIMRRLAISRYREKTAGKRVPEQMTVAIDDLYDSLCAETTVPQEYEAARLGQLINEYLATLDRRRRYIFIGRYYMGDTLSTIAGELHVNTSTVHREIEAIKRDLRAHLERNGVTI